MQKPATPIYLDNNATTPIAAEVLAAMMPYLTQEFGNPSSLHPLGVTAEQAVKKAREGLARLFQAKAQEIIFTSGGSESINLGIKGVAYAAARRGRHIITAATEHEAVLASVKQLAREGFNISYADVDAQGRVITESVCRLVQPETILVALMHVNNELGTINPMTAVAQAVKTINPQTYFFVDGVQGFGKQPLTLKNIDLYAMSGHKCHAPKGIGALYVKSGTPLRPLIHGGGQEDGRRAGTENVAAIVGLAMASELAYQQLSANRQHWQTLKNRLVTFLTSLPNTHLHSPLDGAENTVNVSFVGVPGEVMMYALAAKGIFVSTGAACGSSKRQASHVLRAIGLANKYLQSAIRFSFSRQQTLAEIDAACQAISEVLQRLQKIL